MSRVIHRAPLAVTSDGDMILNLAHMDIPRRLEELVKVAVRQRGAIFIGVTLSKSEVVRLLGEAAMVLPNVTAPMVGRRQRGSLHWR